MSAIGKDPPREDAMDRMFNPRHLAVVGVSSQGKGFGSAIMWSLESVGFEGTLYPVNPHGGRYRGVEMYRSVRDISHDIDFAIICTPAETVPAVLEECLEKGAAGAEILSSGFGEVGTPEGRALEESVRSVARRGLRVIGPNCFGIYSPRSGLTLMPGPDLSREPGSVAFLSQSGGMAIDLAQLGKSLGVTFSAMVSFGNAADLRETELLEYLSRDPDTGTICMYTEGVASGPDFMRILRETGREKPVIVHKGGLSEDGARAVAGHTASMAGNRVIWESVLRQANAIQVGSLAELSQAALAFSMLPRREYRAVSVIGGGGALGITACDLAERHGISIPPLTGNLRREIEAVLPQPGSSATNPVDAANPHVPPDILKAVLENAARDPSIDLQILVQLIYQYKVHALYRGVSVKETMRYRELVEAVGEVAERSGKPIVLVIPNNKFDADSMDIEELRREVRRLSVKRGIPVFDEMDEAFRAIGHVNRYCSRRNGMAREWQADSPKGQEGVGALRPPERGTIRAT